MTRPAAQADAWVHQLEASGIVALALPLIAIAPAVGAAPLDAAWRGLASRRLVVFVSVNAVQHFFAARPRDVPWPAGVTAAAPGPGTGQALRDAGVDSAMIVEPGPDAPQLDSEALWQQLCGRDWRGASALIVRGDGGREWLAERLAEAGAVVGAVSAYVRAVPQLSDEARRLIVRASAEPHEYAWLFSSSQAIANLEVLAGVPPGAQAIATHPRIAARARQAGFARVVEVQPGLAAVAACIQSLRP